MLILIYVDSFICPLYLKFSQIFFYKFFLHFHFILFTSQSYSFPSFTVRFSEVSIILCVASCLTSYVTVLFYPTSLPSVASSCLFLLTRAYSWITYFSFLLLLCSYEFFISFKLIWQKALWYDGWYKSNIFSRQFSCWECYLPFFSCFFLLWECI